MNWSPKARVVMALMAMAALGMGAMLATRIPALGLDKAGFCGKCHAMDQQVASYLHSAHRDTANCGDCHDPDSLFAGSVYAAYTGSRDVYRVVTNTTPKRIRATHMSKGVIQNNCIRCHKETVCQIGDTSRGGGLYCFDCHRRTPHNR